MQPQELYKASIFQLLSSAATFDPAVASAFIDSGGSKCGSLLFDLLDRVQSCSLGTNDNFWWVARVDALRVFGYSLQTLLQKEDGSYAFFDRKDGDTYDPAVSFFFDRLMPVLQPMFTAKNVGERAASFDCFEKVCNYLPQMPLLNLITKKKVWGCFEEAVRFGVKHCMPSNEAVKSSWESYLSYIALCNLARVLEGFTGTCTKSFKCFISITDTSLLWF
jgi:hypothetical protein